MPTPDNPPPKFSSISKNFRNKYCPAKHSSNHLTEHEASEHFANLCASSPHINWDKRFKYLSQCRYNPLTKNLFWRIPTNNLYMSERAADHLSSINKEDEAEKYKFCPYCQTQTLSSLSHQFWDCPCVKPFWSTVFDLLHSHNLPNPITSFSDLCTFTSPESSKDITLLYRDDLLSNAVFSIWTAYNDLMWSWGSLDRESFNNHVNSLYDTLIKKYNILNYQSFLLLPHHVRYIKNINSHASNTHSNTNGLLVKYHLLQPTPVFDLAFLEDDYHHAYSITWCKCNTLAKFVDNKPCFCALPFNLHSR